MKKILIVVLLVVAFLFVVKSCCYRSLSLSPTYTLQESQLDGVPWYCLESDISDDPSAPSAAQGIDGIQRDGDRVYIWLNGTQQPDYYVIDTRADTCEHLSAVPPHIQWLTPQAFLNAN